jgi:hypothetical protein
MRLDPDGLIIIEIIQDIDSVDTKLIYLLDIRLCRGHGRGETGYSQKKKSHCREKWKALVPVWDYSNVDCESPTC